MELEAFSFLGLRQKILLFVCRLGHWGLLDIISQTYNTLGPLIVFIFSGDYSSNITTYINFDWPDHFLCKRYFKNKTIFEGLGTSI